MPSPRSPCASPELEAAPATRIDSASTATPGQTFTWLPGDAWSEYCEAQP